MTQGISYLSVCSGLGGAALALDPLGFREVANAEIEPFCAALLDHRYGSGRPWRMPDPEAEGLTDDERRARRAAIRAVAHLEPTALGGNAPPNLGDFTQIDPSELPPVDMLIGGTPCFTAGHLVLTGNGFRPIETIAPGDMVVTHKGRLRRVVRIGSKSAAVGVLEAVGLQETITCTPDHPFLSAFWRNQNTRRGGRYALVEHLSDLGWISAKDMAGRQWCALTQYELTAARIPAGRFDEEQAMYVAGLYVGDGHIRQWAGREKRAVVLSLNPQKMEKLRAVISTDTFFVSQERTSVRATINDTGYANWLDANFGRHSHLKNIPAWVLGHPKRKAFMQGLIDSDGHVSRNGVSFSTTSRALAYGIAALLGAEGFSASVGFVATPDETVIEDRTVNQRDYWQVRAFLDDKSRKSRVRHGYRMRTVTGFADAGQATVFNIEVEDDHSYIVNGAVVHNCQAFSFAGLRRGMADARGNLTLGFVELAHGLAETNGTRCALWENVPGVLSDDDNAFGCFLGGFVGADDALLPCPRPPAGKSNDLWRWRPAGRYPVLDDDGEPTGEIVEREAKHIPKWPRAGMAAGPRARAAWIVRNAQYFGVPQRRERVFVVVDLGGGPDPAAVLFERKSLREHSREGGKARQDVAGPVKASAARRGGREDNGDGHSLIPEPVYLGNAEGGAEDAPFLTASNLGKTVNNQTPLVGEPVMFKPSHYTRDKDGAPATVAPPLSADADKGDQDAVLLAPVCFGLSTQQEPKWAENLSPTLALPSKSGGGQVTAVAHALRAEGDQDPVLLAPVPFVETQITSPTNRSNPQPGDPAPTLAAHAHPPAIAFSCKDHGADATMDLAPTLRAMPHAASHANAGGQLAVAFDLRGREGGVQFEGPHDTANLRAASGGSSRSYVAFAFEERGRGDDGRGYDRAPHFSEELAPTVNTVKPPAVAQEWAVRRLLPVECERLQGVPSYVKYARFSACYDHLNSCAPVDGKSLKSQPYVSPVGVDANSESARRATDHLNARLHADAPHAVLHVLIDSGRAEAVILSEAHELIAFVNGADDPTESSHQKLSADFVRAVAHICTTAGNETRLGAEVFQPSAISSSVPWNGVRRAETCGRETRDDAADVVPNGIIQNNRSKSITSSLGATTKNCAMICEISFCFVANAICSFIPPTITLANSCEIRCAMIVGHTDIPWRGKGHAPDGPRYKAIGNGWAMPVVRWIGERIAANWPKD